MKIVLTNDDGIDAPGLGALAKAVEGWGESVTVAPAFVQSGVGHQVTTKSPIVVVELEQGRFSVDGTPADCSRLALTEIAPDADWVIAGVNQGGNLGADVYTSGTVAAAREAALLGYRAIAVSQYVAKGCPLNWDVIADRVAPLLKRLIAYELLEGEYWNINLPHAPADEGLEVVMCALDTRPLSIAYRKENGAYMYRGEYHKRPRQPGRDVDICLGGKISVTKMVLDMGGPAVIPDAFELVVSRSQEESRG
jgi:5'-nucleotidase